MDIKITTTAVMKSGWKSFLSLTMILGISGSFQAGTQIQEVDILNTPVDVSKDFVDYNNTFYFADELSSFNPETGIGTVKYLRHEYQTRQAFNNMLMRAVPVEAIRLQGKYSFLKMMLYKPLQSQKKEIILKSQRIL